MVVRPEFFLLILLCPFKNNIIHILKIKISYFELRLEFRRKIKKLALLLRPPVFFCARVLNCPAKLQSKFIVENHYLQMVHYIQVCYLQQMKIVIAKILISDFNIKFLDSDIDSSNFYVLYCKNYYSTSKYFKIMLSLKFLEQKFRF